jgi:hypothetical protein
MPRCLLIIISFSVLSAFANTPESKTPEAGNYFAGRVSRTNKVAGLMRIRTDSTSVKFLRQRDRVEFWNESYPDKKCLGYLEGRTNDYFLIRVAFYDDCLRKVQFTTGSYLHFSSPDMDQTLVTVRELNEVLLKKRLAMQAKKTRHQRDLDGYVEKVDVVNKRYEILRQKLEIEWSRELANLEEDKATTFTEFKNAEARLNEIDTKLEAYKIEDHNLKLDRWSLDPALYIKK